MSKGGPRKPADKHKGPGRLRGRLAYAPLGAPSAPHTRPETRPPISRRSAPSGPGAAGWETLNAGAQSSAEPPPPVLRTRPHRPAPRVPAASPCGRPCRSPRPGRLRPGAPAYPQGSASSSGCASSTAPRRHLRQLLPTCASTCGERLWGGGRRPRELLEGVLRPRGRLQRRKQEGHREEAGTQTSCPRAAKGWPRRDCPLLVASGPEHARLACPTCDRGNAPPKSWCQTSVDPRNLESFIIKTVRTAHPHNRGEGRGKEGRRGWGWGCDS